MKEIKYNMSRNHNIEYDGLVYEFDANPSKGIFLPFQLYIPNDMDNDKDLIVTCRTPRSTTVSFEEALDKAKEMNIGPAPRMLSSIYKNPMLLPVIPRYPGLDTTYLGYGVYHQDYEELIDLIKKGTIKLTEEDLHKFDKIDEQVVNMIKSALEFIRSTGKTVNDKVIMSGYSAGSKFSNYFSALHPEVVKSVISGGTGGLTIMPLKEINGWTLDYPIGFNDLGDELLESFKNINHFYFIGDSDYNDVSIPKSEPSILGYDDNNEPIYEKDECGNILPKKDEKGNIVYILDEEGNYLPHYSGGNYSNYQINAINKGIADNVQTRFDLVEEIYKENGVNATFKKYPGNHITVFDNKELKDDICAFYESLKSKKETIMK